MLFFNCPRDLARERVLNRNLGRAGDNSEVFERRYKGYLELNPDILDHYGGTRGKDKLVEVGYSQLWLSSVTY